LYRPHGIAFEQAAPTKSDIYLDFLHILNSRRMRFLDEPTQIAELLGRERRTRWGGRESIDHPQGNNFHDDAINAVAGAAVLAATVAPPIVVTTEMLAVARQHPAMRRLQTATTAPGMFGLAVAHLERRH
jgi:hypothetical protein